MSRFAHSAREVMLTVGALLGVLCIVMTLASIAFDIKPLMFQSGSMSPAISTGDLAIARTVDASQLEQGDIVSVVNASGTRITHRLVESTVQADVTQLVLKGDANKTPDAEVYATARADRVLFNIPKAGYVVHAMTGTVGVFVLGIYVAGLALLLFGRGSRAGHDDRDAMPPTVTGGGPGKPRLRDKSQLSRSGARTLAIVLSASIAMVAAPAVAAPWADTVTVAGSRFTAYTMAKPVITGCTVKAVRTATITFTAVNGPIALNYTATVRQTGLSLTVVDNGATREIEFTTDLPGLSVDQTYQVDIRTTQASSSGSWVSAVTTQSVTVSHPQGTLKLTCGTGG